MGAGYRIEPMPGYLPSLWQSAPEEMADAVKALAGEILLVLLREKLLCYTIFVTVYLVIDIEKARTKCWL